MVELAFEFPATEMVKAAVDGNTITFGTPDGDVVRVSPRGDVSLEEIGARLESEDLSENGGNE